MNPYKHQKLYLCIEPIDYHWSKLSANCWNVKPLAFLFCIAAIPSMIAAWSCGGCDSGVVSFSKWCKMATLFVLHNSPTTPESDQGNCPKVYLNTSFRSTLQCCIITTIWSNKARCIFNGIMQSFTPTFTTFCRFENVFNPSFFNGSKNQLLPLLPIFLSWILSLRSHHVFLH